jgi:hypothetical protein
MKLLRTLFFIFLSCQAISQTCEKYNRKLFHSLPKTFPDSINCKDGNGKKQGWWIYYKVQYNSVDKPGVIEIGDYVQTYTYGKYEDNRKVGDWRTIENVHLIYERRIDNYYYSKDTILIKSSYADRGWKESVIYYNSDSSIIKYRLTFDREQKDICIECNKNKKPYSTNCIMTYRKKIIKKFPYEQFEIELDKSNSSLFYGREKAIIDETYYK